jgi:hypothetical protein
VKRSTKTKDIPYVATEFVVNQMRGGFRRRIVVPKMMLAQTAMYSRRLMTELVMRR